MTKLQLQLRLDTKEVDHTYIQTCFVDIGRWTTVINQVSVYRLDTRLAKPIEQRTVTKTKQKSLKLKFYSRNNATGNADYLHQRHRTHILSKITRLLKVLLSVCL